MDSGESRAAGSPVGQGHVYSVDLQLPGGAHRSRELSQEGSRRQGLARTRSSQKGQSLAPVDSEADSVNQGASMEGHPQVLNQEGRVHGELSARGDMITDAINNHYH